MTSTATTSTATSSSSIIDPVISGNMQVHCVRFHPNDDLVPCLQEAAKQAMMASNSSCCCFVLTCVGSLKEVELRMANACRINPDTGEKSSSNDIRKWNERFEIVSLVGTFDCNGGFHLHLSISDAKGHTFGGHLISGKVFTTVELVLGTASAVSFTRPHDPQTGFNELKVTQSSTSTESSSKATESSGSSPPNKRLKE